VVARGYESLPAVPQAGRRAHRAPGVLADRSLAAGRFRGPSPQVKTRRCRADSNQVMTQHEMEQRAKAEENAAWWLEQRRGRTDAWLTGEVMPTAILSAVIIVVVATLTFAFWPLGVLAWPAAKFIRMVWREIWIPTS
jgi:hypothetical protein